MKTAVMFGCLVAIAGALVGPAAWAQTGHKDTGRKDAGRKDTGRNDIGFASPEIALRTLKTRAGIEFTEKAGWIVAIDKEHETVWLFAHPGDPSYPTMVKRSPVQTAKGWVIESRIMCGGPQPVCDEVAAQFAK